MRSWPGLALSALLLVGCAGTRPRDNPDCARSASFEKGAGDAALGRPRGFHFPRACPEELHAERLRAYREGYESARPKRAAEGRVMAGTRVADGYAALPAARRAWVCEVEASEKIFTGMGASRTEASEVAHATCSSHFRASYCHKTECKQSL